MSTKERKPLLSDAEFYASEDFGAGELEYNISRSEVRRIYEAARAKDAERIEQLEAAAKAVVERWNSPAWKYSDPHTGELIAALARAAGITT